MSFYIHPCRQVHLRDDSYLPWSPVRWTDFLHACTYSQLPADERLYSAMRWNKFIKRGKAELQRHWGVWGVGGELSCKDAIWCVKDEEDRARGDCGDGEEGIRKERFVSCFAAERSSAESESFLIL